LVSCSEVGFGINVVEYLGSATGGSIDEVEYAEFITRKEATLLHSQGFAFSMDPKTADDKQVYDFNQDTPTPADKF
jgi:hypothetical protein